MTHDQRLLALLDVYDEAIEELYVLGDRRFVDLILRLERRRRDAEQRLARGRVAPTIPLDSGFLDQSYPTF